MLTRIGRVGGTIGFLMFLISILVAFPHTLEYMKQAGQARKEGSIPPSYSSYIKKIIPYLIVAFLGLGLLLLMVALGEIS